jgi:hypothetical protein
MAGLLWLWQLITSTPEQPAHGTSIEHIDRTPLMRRKRTMRALLLARR